MAATFHVSLELKGGKDEVVEAVHYKNDGERFPDGQQNTIKLNVTSCYTFTVTFRPAKILTHWMIRGEKLEFERVKPPKEDDDMSIYQAHWNSTGMNVTKRGERYPLPIEMELEPGLVMKSSLQTKFYPAAETIHRKWGPEVHSLEYKCEALEGHMTVDIQHEKIL